MNLRGRLGSLLHFVSPGFATQLWTDRPGRVVQAKQHASRNVPKAEGIPNSLLLTFLAFRATKTKDCGTIFCKPLHLQKDTKKACLHISSRLAWVAGVRDPGESTCRLLEVPKDTPALPWPELRISFLPCKQCNFESVSVGLVGAGGCLAT